MNAIPLRRRLRYGAVASLITLAGFAATDSPYYRVGPGPVIQVGGSWSVTTARVSPSNWFQWSKAELTGQRTIRGGDAPPMPQTMAASQTNAVLVAAQLAARRTPVGGTGLQVTDAPGLHPGDILLATQQAGVLTPLRTQNDLRTPLRQSRLQVLVVPMTSANTWGTAELRPISAAHLAQVRVRETSAAAYPLGDVQGPSAGLILALARVDALTPGDLTGGRRIAGTGAINSDGTVTTVGEVTEKIHAAIAARADVFLVPTWQSREATAAAKGTNLKIIPVRTTKEALNHLCTTAAQPLTHVSTG
ncbi:hypothetical protein GCM10010191_10130 [Actinomadura vinacea]|uniref:Lon proteolytic domain-containing protein n=1 Tax=Actinomadura vinacea TaxID=115336 RepID=A0ABN3IH50_9ACTN